MKSMNKKSAILVLFMFLASIVLAQKEVGVWKTIDDNTKKEKSHVEIYIKNGKLYGKVVKILDESRANAKCTECKGDLYNKPIVGMQIINGLDKRKDDWYKKEGILDPENGKLYDCKIWLSDNKTLQVRGYLGPFYRTQTWYRIK